MTHSNDNCCCCCCKRKREYPSVQQTQQQQQQQTQQQQTQQQQTQQQQTQPCLAGSHWDSTRTMCVPDSGTFGTKPVSTSHQILHYTFLNGVKSLSPLTPGEQKFIDVLNTQDDQHVTATPDQAAIYRAFGRASSSELNPTQKAIYDILVDPTKQVTDLTPAQQSIAFNAQTRDAIKPSSLNSQQPSSMGALPSSLGNDNRFGTRPLPTSKTFPTTNTFSTNVPTSNPLNDMFPTTSSLPIPAPSSNIPFSPLTTVFPLTTPSGLPTPGPGASFLGIPTPAPDPVVPPDIDPNGGIDDPPPSGPVPTAPAPPPSQCPNYHPDATIPNKTSQAGIVRSITAYVNSKGYRHDPDGIPWLRRSNWVDWDGVTTINPCTSTTAQLMAFIFPPPGGVNTMRGLRQLFYQVNPFTDNSNPTVSEIENWNIEVIRLFRRLLGFNQTTHPVYNDKCTYLKAAWAEERARTNYWTASYPGTQDSASGPCTLPDSANAHCGAGFLLNPSDQTPYLCPSTMAPCTITSGAEGISTHNTDIPWGIKMSRIIGMFLASDGIGAHTGPFVGRTYFGSAWYIKPTSPGTLIVRTKWSGHLSPTCP